MNKTIAFLCVENSCRSQIAEALAKKTSKNPDLKFVSAGTHPADEVDRGALEILRNEGIIWHGEPKLISDSETIDYVVTMGCEIVCPVIPGAEIIEWDILDPKGKTIEDYRKTLSVIKENILKLLKELE